jgi:ATP-dependent Clp protease ATP-binding subunit ClpC
VLVLSQEEARRLEHGFIGTEHILLGLIEEGEGLAARALESLGVDLMAARLQVEELVPPGRSPATGSPPFTPRAKKVLELSLREALQLGHNYIGTEHMLLGLIREGDGVAAQALVRLSVDLGSARAEVLRLLAGYPGHERQGGVNPGASGELSKDGTTWWAKVVRPGRTPAAFGDAYQALEEIAGRLGAHLDPDLVTVKSVATSEGPGLLISVDRAPVNPS